MNAQKQPFLTRRKFEKNGLCQNSTDGALQAWSLLFLCRVLLESQAQAISAQKHPFCLELAFPMGEQGTLLAVIALIVAVVGIFLPIPLTLMRSAGCERSLRRMISAVSSAWRMASEGLWKRLAADRKIEVAIVSGVRFVTKLERHPNMALVQARACRANWCGRCSCMWLRTAKSRAWMRECHRFDSKLDTSDAVDIASRTCERPWVRLGAMSTTGRARKTSGANHGLCLLCVVQASSIQQTRQVLNMLRWPPLLVLFVVERVVDAWDVNGAWQLCIGVVCRSRPLDVSSDPDRCSEFDRRKFAVGSGALCLSQGSCKRKCSERADCHHVQTYVNEEVCYLKPLACEAEDHWYADQEYFAFAWPPVTSAYQAVSICVFIWWTRMEEVALSHEHLELYFPSPVHPRLECPNYESQTFCCEAVNRFKCFTVNAMEES
ncbi:unnamed protein product [Symbiodinium sp. KB8]|nr:unnamed protein product [Symbiodinium sp. KB8]